MLRAETVLFFHTASERMRGAAMRACRCRVFTPCAALGAAQPTASAYATVGSGREDGGGGGGEDVLRGMWRAHARYYNERDMVEAVQMVP